MGRTLVPLTIYLDNNATTKIDPQVAELIRALSLQGVANPASQHGPGRQALKLLEQAKTDLLSLTGASNTLMDTAQVIWTSGGTEANNLALLGIATKQPGMLVVAASEHSSVLEAAKRAAASLQQPCHILAVDDAGHCDLDQLEAILRQDAANIALVSVMLGNNETGVIQDLETICKLCNRYQVKTHSDVVQAIGKLPFNMLELGLSAITLTAHKIHGPVGIGALILAPNLQLEPMLVGGGQQLAIRPGTEPVIPAVALAAALQHTCQARLDGTYQRIASLRDEFESKVLTLGDTYVVGQAPPRLPHTSNIAFWGLDRQALQMALDLRGLACSTGSACSSGSSRPSAVLTAMKLPDRTISSSLRFSFSKYSTLAEAHQAAEIVCSVVERLRSNRSNFKVRS
ncbi:cysteine desulfurase family protein [Aureliella helgolandensis]|uniref:Cysteine desulfurase n=1 Tax=Aureliella helgolandensis TaxID=2527968 RepID=A0A518GHR6_9BACT|nr:cysteine desulfurase family protein [Aureliella helgolandensis]QDV28139.1 Cysteine desulfurase [Aureliella helgolandensis]